MATCNKSDLEPSEVECPVCSDLFTLPKILPCGHLVCRHCLLSWLQSKEDAGCPLCRCAIRDDQDKQTGRSVQEMVDEFPTDLAMAALVEAHRLMAKQHVCCVCDSVAETMCMDCGDTFCGNCKVNHTKQSVSKHHKLEDLTSLTTETLATRRAATCADHKDKQTLFCPSHGAYVCVSCLTTTHHQCQQFVSLQTRMQDAVTELEQVTALLTEGERQVDLSMDQLDQHIEETQKRADHALNEIQAMGKRLESAVRDCCIRLNDMVRKVADDVIQVVNDVKSVLLQRRGKLVTHKTVTERSKRQHEKRSVPDVITQLTARVTDLHRKSTTPIGDPLVRSFNFTLNRDAETKILQELSQLGSVAFYPLTGVALLEQTEFEFHPRHGTKIKLSNNNKTAERTSQGAWDGIVISRDPMQPRTLFEVEVQAIQIKQTSSLLGVLTTSPDTFTIPSHFYQSDTSVLCMYNAGQLYTFSQQKDDERLKKLHNLTVGSRVGLALDQTRNLHLYLQGNDQGVIATNIPQPAYFVFDLIARCSKVTAQPLTHIE